MCASQHVAKLLYSLLNSICPCLVFEQGEQLKLLVFAETIGGNTVFAICIMLLPESSSETFSLINTVFHITYWLEIALSCMLATVSLLLLTS